VAYDVQWARLDTGPELPYVVQGDATGTPVVLLHGYAESWRSFELVLRQLPRELRAFAVSQRGHGGPRTHAGDYSLRAMADDVPAFMDALGLDAAVVAGASMGGYVAQRLAADHPERVAGLVLIGSPRTLQAIPAVAAFAERLDGQPDPVDRGFVREFVASTLGARPLPAAFLEAMRNDAQAVPKHVWQLTLDALTEAAPPTDAASIATPAMVLWGERDEYVSRDDAERLAGAIVGSTLVVYEGCGHALAWEQPGRVATDIAGFVERLRV